MGMYDKDENFGEHFNPGDRFVVTGLRFAGEINTRFGMAKLSHIEIVTRGVQEKVKYAMIGEGFAAQAQHAEPSDFPHVAEYTVKELDGGNKVKLLTRVDVDPRAFLNGDDGPALEEQVIDALKTSFGATEIDPLGF